MEILTRPELGVLADDLTGATDTGLQFAKCGHRTCVCLAWPATPACDVLVFDTDSRHLDAPQARQRSGEAARALQAAGVRRFYKKIDSTARGNLGAEIEGALEATGLAQALICPAFPKLARTVRDGQVFVRGVPLPRTEFAHDPTWPATTASLEAILRRQSDAPIARVDLAEVRRGPATVRARLAEHWERGTRLVVADAEVDLDLRCLVEAARQSGQGVLTAGSAGLAEWLVGLLSHRTHPARNSAVGKGATLIVSGTVNRTGVGQLARLIEQGAAHTTLAIDAVLDDAPAATDAAAGQVVDQLRLGGCVVLSLADPRRPAPDVGQFAAEHRLSPSELNTRLVNALAAVTEQAIGAVLPAALIVTGGDTARAVTNALGSNALEVEREAAPGVPICVLQGGRWDGLVVVTKAGGFGEPDTLVRVVRQLEEQRT
ncbi:MAG TPA: four-carbon acid sugar kinase family protein [Chloroflexota bacterium]|nr:four-carbon acid sugar kinase family protein [Chloroflexota bacterium]